MPAVSGRYPSGQRGQTVNLLAYAFGGSNPPLPTSFERLSCEVASGLTGGNSSAVERQPSKLGVAGSNPVSRSMLRRAAGRTGAGAPPAASRVGRAARRCGEETPDDGRIHGDSFAHVAQLAEHALGKGEVSGSIPDMGSRWCGESRAARGWGPAAHDERVDECGESRAARG